MVDDGIRTRCDSPAILELSGIENVGEAVGVDCASLISREAAAQKAGVLKTTRTVLPIACWYLSYV